MKLKQYNRVFCRHTLLNIKHLPWKQVLIHYFNLILPPFCAGEMLQKSENNTQE